MKLHLLRKKLSYPVGLDLLVIGDVKMKIWQKKGTVLGLPIKSWPVS